MRSPGGVVLLALAEIEVIKVIKVEVICNVTSHGLSKSYTVGRTCGLRLRCFALAILRSSIVSYIMKEQVIK